MLKPEFLKLLPLEITQSWRDTILQKRLLLLLLLSWSISLPLSIDSRTIGVHYSIIEDDSHLAPAILWENSYSLQYRSLGWIGHEIHDGSFIIAGVHPSEVCFDRCEFPGWLMRLEQNGVQNWYQFIGNYSSYYPVRLLTIDPSSFLLAGEGEIYGLFPELDRFITLHWIDAEGTWFRNISLTQWTDDFLIDVLPLLNGSFVVLTSGGNAFWINATGALLSNHSYTPFSYDFQSVASGCQDGGFIKVGQNHTMKPSGISILRVNASGSVFWSKNYQSTLDLQPRHVTEDGEGGFLIVGTMGNETTTPPMSLWIKRINTSGDTLWTLPLETHSVDVVTGLTRTVDGDYIIAGNREGRLYGWRVTNLGDIVWASDFGGELNGVFADVLTCQNGEYVAIGTDYTNSDDSLPFVRRFDEQMAPTSPTLFSTLLTFPYPHIQLTWSDSTDVDGTVTGYRLQMSPSATFSNNITSIFSVSNSTSILPSGYPSLYYRVAAIDNRGTYSYWSNVVFVQFDGLTSLFTLIFIGVIGISIAIIIPAIFLILRLLKKKK